MKATAKPLDPAELGAWRGLLEAQSSMVRVLDSELEREHGLPLTSYEVLLQLGEAKGDSLRMGELAERIFLSRSGLTRLVDRLARAGLVSREECTSDRRGSFAQLTDAGRAKLEAARSTHLRGIREHFLSRLDDADRAHLTRIWGKVLSEDG